MKISKKALSVLLCTVMILGSLAVGGEGFIDALDLLSVKASAEQSGIFTYEVTDGKVTITCCDSSASGEITIPSTLDGYPVTSIGEFAFNFTNLTSVIIPGSVTSIGDYAFYGCGNLTSIHIPDSVTSIGENAFSSCYSLTSVTIGSGVTSIGDCAFFDCTGLKSVTIGSGVTSIGEFAFNNCDVLTSIHIPDSVTSIGYHAFDDCSGLQSVTIGSGVTSIGDCAFSGCSSLTSIHIPDSVTSIGAGVLVGTAFYDDSSNWENGALYCGNHLLSVDSNITGSFSVKEGTVTIAVGAFSKCHSLTSIHIPDGITSIGVYAFYYCTGLKSVTIGSGVTSIGDYAFSGCSSLTSIHIPDSVTSIEKWTFDNCSGLTSVCIPGSIEIINFSAFDHCSSLRDVYFTGSEEQELNIIRGNEPLTEATWHYNYVHTYTVTKESTCTEAGSKIINCECGAFTESIPPLGHDYAVTYEWSADGKTCTATATCKNNANHVVTENATITSAVKEKPACEKKGTATYTASFTNELFSTQTKDVEDIDALGHDYVNHDAKAPNCEEIGWEAYQTCKRCDYTSYKEIPPTGHTDEDNDGICDVCRETIDAEANKAFLESKITLNIPGEATVRFRNKAAVTVTADNLPEGYTLAIYDGDTLLAQSKPGEDSVTYTTGELQKAVTLTVKVLDKDGNAVTGKTGEIKVNVNKNIFTIIIALILGIFRKLPTVTVKP